MVYRLPQNLPKHHHQFRDEQYINYRQLYQHLFVRRLTKTLLIVSAAAVFSWLPHAIILNMTAAHMVSVPIIIFHCFYILTYSSSFVNPIIYALKIPEFRQSLITVCSRRRAVDRMHKIRLIDLIEPRTLQTDPSYTERNFNTSLWTPK